MLDRCKKQLENAKIWPPEKANRVGEVWGRFIEPKYGELSGLLANYLEGSAQWEPVHEELKRMAAQSPYVITGFHFAPDKGEAQMFSLLFSDQERVAIDVLEYRNILKKEQYWEMVQPFKADRKPFRGTLTIFYFQLTELGLHFLKRVSPPEAG